MQTETPRQRARKLATDLYKSISPDAAAVKEMVGLLLEDAKNNLLQQTGDDMLRTQGEARAYAKLHKDLTTASPVPSKE